MAISVCTKALIGAEGMCAFMCVCVCTCEIHGCHRRAKQTRRGLYGASARFCQNFPDSSLHLLIHLTWLVPDRIPNAAFWLYQHICRGNHPWMSTYHTVTQQLSPAPGPPFAARWAGPSNRGQGGPQPRAWARQNGQDWWFWNDIYYC